MAVPIFVVVRDRQRFTDSYFCVSFVIPAVSDRSQLPQAGLDVNVNSNAVGHLPELRGDGNYK